ncbi:hypothetical protein BYT27DRAFT_7169395 [Phlegmacium glaucopus]|nr:hypothetical protein BYT27DRAFT_7169395 [Phlegmacium glaucopus]
MISIRPRLTRGSMRLGFILLSLVVIYILVVDGYLRPRTTTLTIEDLDESDFGIIPFEPASSQYGNDTRILLVSAMFPLAKSKHSKDDYAIWLGRFVGVMTTDMYMYTVPDLVETFKQIRGSLPITIDTSYSSPFEVPPMVGLEETYTNMSSLDKENWRHSPELYAVWNAKPFLLQTALRNLADKGIHYDYAFWNDGGSFRNIHAYRDWPDPGRVAQVWDETSKLTGKDKNDLLFLPIFQPPNKKLSDWKEDMGPITSNPIQFTEGSFFGGSQSSVEWFSRVYYAYHDHYLKNGFFVGIDQDIFNALLLLFPERIFTVWLNDPRAPARQGIVPSPSLKPSSLESGFLGECGPEWFYYQFWFADRTARHEMRRIWISEERWRMWGWWQDRKACRLTGAIPMMDVIQRSFGESWQPPTKRVPTSS